MKLTGQKMEFDDRKDVRPSIRCHFYPKELMLKTWIFVQEIALRTKFLISAVKIYNDFYNIK